MGLADQVKGPLGQAAKRWAKAKATELWTTDNRRRDDAEHEAWHAEREAQRAGSEAIARDLFPGYAQRQDRLEQRAADAAAAADDAHRDDQASIKPGDAEIRLAGAVDAHWSGPLRVTWEVTDPSASDDADDDLHEPDDPFAGRPVLVLTAEPVAEERPVLGGGRLAGFTVTVHGYEGDGHHDLVVVDRRRQAAGVTPMFETGLTLDGDDSAFWFDAGAGPSTVDVSGSGTRASVELHLAGPAGALAVTLDLRR